MHLTSIATVSNKNFPTFASFTMESNIVFPVPEEEATEKGDEKLNGRWWRVKSPIPSPDVDGTKFHCV
jgi:hypothetical protein